MGFKEGKSSLKILAIALLALLIAWCLLQLPAWKDQWLHGFYTNQQVLKAVQTANDINPFVTEDHSLGSHIRFQNLLRQAGAEQRLLEHYQQTAENYPQDANVQAYYARVLEDEEKKVNILEKARELNPNDPAVLFVLAEHQLQNGQAKETLKLIRNMDSGTWYIHALRAKAYSQTGEIEQARSEYRKAIQAENSPASVLLSYAEFLLESGQEEAESPFKKWSEDERIEEPLAYAYHAYFSGQDIQTFAEDLPSGVGYDPKALLILAKAALRRDEVNTAERLLLRAEQFAPENPMIRFYRGLAALRQGNEVMADTLLHPKENLSEKEHAELGTALWKEGQKEFAVKHFQHAGVHTPPNPEVTVELVKYYLDQNKCEHAGTIVDRNLNLFLNQGETSLAIGQQLEACGEFENAAELYGSVLDHDFHNKEARDLLANVYVQLGEKNRAILLYDVYLKNNANDAHSFAKVAKIHRHFGDHKNAREILDYVLNNPDKFEDISLAKRLDKEWKEKS